MQWRIDVYHHFVLNGEDKASTEKIMAELDALRAEISRNTSVSQSAVMLLQGVAQKIEASKTDPNAIQQLVDELRTNTDSLAQAVAQNTPAEQPGTQPPTG